eukprot:COSAG03_NODE_133_length_11910_cov_3.872407_4_plen_148_part_00
MSAWLAARLKLCADSDAAAAAGRVHVWLPGEPRQPRPSSKPSSRARRRRCRRDRKSTRRATRHSLQQLVQTPAVSYLSARSARSGGLAVSRTVALSAGAVAPAYLGCDEAGAAPPLHATQPQCKCARYTCVHRRSQIDRLVRFLVEP